MQVRACACTRVTGPAAIQFVRHTAQSNVYHPSRTLGSDRRDLRGTVLGGRSEYINDNRFIDLQCII